MGYEFFEKQITFPSAPVPGINDDQSLKGFSVPPLRRPIYLNGAVFR